MSDGQKSDSGAPAPRQGSADVVDLRAAAGRRALPQPRKAILVVGMHRSGTSALTRVVSLLGADLPRELMPPAAGDNPTGFWESPAIAELHDELLAAAGSSWHDVSPLPAGWFSSDTAAAYGKRLVELLERDFAESRLFVVKDPRIARLLPLWQAVLRQLAAEPRYLLIVRNPLEVAASLKARNGFLPAKSYLLWLSHLLESERHSRRHPRAFVLYEQLLRDWRGTAERLERELRLGWPRLSATAAVEIEEFLNERQRHHHADSEELEARSDAVSWVKRAWSAVREAASGSDGGLADTLDSIRLELARADAAFAPLLAQGRLRLERREADLGELRQELDAQRRAAERSSIEVAARGEEVQRLTGALDQRQGAVDTLAAERERAHAEVEARGAEIQRLTDALDERQGAVDTLAAERERAHAEVKARGAEIQRLTDALDERQRAVDTLAAERDRARAEADARGEEIQRLTAVLGERQAAVDSLSSELTSGQQREDRLGIQLAHAEGVVESLQRLGRDREERLGGLAKELELLRAGQETRRHEIAGLEAEVRTQQMLTGLRADEIMRLRDELAAGRDESAALAGERARLRANMELQSERLVELDGELRAAGETVTARETEITRLREELERRGRENERLGHELAEGADTAEELRGRLARAGDEIADLAGSLRGSQATVESLQRQVALEQGRARGFELSRSWRATRPLRWLAGSLRPRTRRLRRLRRQFEASGAAALFDVGYYLEQLGGLDEAGGEPVLHYLDRGCRTGRNPHPLFDSAFYLQHCPEAAEDGAVGLTHYFERGAGEGRDPHPLFRTSYYLQGLPAPLAPDDNPLLHFLRHGAAEGRSPHPLFDLPFYLESNPDVATEPVNPLVHYVRWGGREGRAPHPLFDAAHYLDRNPQVERAGENPLLHYLRAGAARGCDPHPQFDTAYYEKTNPDSAGSGMTHLEHYLTVGAARGTRTRVESGRRVLIVDHRLPAPDQDSGSLRMSHLISVLQELGWRVTFLPHNLFDMEPYTAQLRQSDVEVLVRPEVESIAAHLEAQGGRYDLVIVCRVTVATDCFPLLRAHCHRAKIVFDTIDLQHLRQLRRAAHEGDERLEAAALQVKAAELELARSADATWVVSPYEQRLLAGEAPDLDVRVISNIHVIHGRRGGFDERRDLLFIGGFEHPPNVDAVEWLAGEILPLVHREEPELRAFLVGSKPPERVLRLASDRVTITGYVPDVEPYFSRCRLSVAPLRFGAGVKGKVNQSLAHGVPCVLTRIAAEGMGLKHRVDAMIADDAEELAGCILAVYRDAELWRRLSDGGIENVRRHFSIPVARAAVAEALHALDPGWHRERRPA